MHQQLLKATDKKKVSFVQNLFFSNMNVKVFIKRHDGYVSQTAWLHFSNNSFCALVCAKSNGLKNRRKSEYFWVFFLAFLYLHDRFLFV